MTAGEWIGPDTPVRRAANTEEFTENFLLRARCRTAAKLLRCVEIHQNIDWATEDLKDRFYQAIDLLEEE